MSGNKRVTATDLPDPDDAPELTDAFFDEADEFAGKQLVRRGRPRSPNSKILLSVRYSPDVVTYFKASGSGWQARMDAALKEYIATHSG